MSHISKMGFKINDLDALAKGAKEIGMELRLGQKKFKYFANNQGQCDAAIVVPGNSDAYEIGVVKKGTNDYELQWDTWGGGKGLVAKVGKDGGLLQQSYIIQREKKVAVKAGHRVEVVRRANGNLVLRAMC